jgi:hypothetical protein
MITLSLDDKTEALTEQIEAAKGNDHKVEELEQQRSEVLIKRYPAYRDHNIGNKPTLKTQKYTEFVDCPDAVDTVKEAIKAGKVFALASDNSNSSYVFFIGQDWATVVRVMSGMRGKVYSMSQPSTAEAREQYKGLLGEGYRKINADALVAAIIKEYC